MSFLLFFSPLEFHILRLLRRSACADYKNSGVLLETFTTQLPVRVMILTGKPVLSEQKRFFFLDLVSCRLNQGHLCEKHQGKNEFTDEGLHIFDAQRAKLTHLSACMSATVN